MYILYNACFLTINRRLKVRKNNSFRVMPQESARFSTVNLHPELNIHWLMLIGLGVDVQRHSSVLITCIHKGSVE